MYEALCLSNITFNILAALLWREFELKEMKCGSQVARLQSGSLSHCRPGVIATSTGSAAEAHGYAFFELVLNICR